MTLPTATPTPPTAGDRDLLAFANSAEFAARDLYALAANLSVFADDERRVLVGFHDHHLAAAQALAGLIGSKASNERADSVYQAFRSRISGTDKNAIYDALREVENTLVSTHLSLVGVLDGTEGSALVSSILSIQARHAVTLALVAGRSISDALTNGAAPLAPGDGS
jgi:hypothetical protein